MDIDNTDIVDYFYMELEQIKNKEIIQQLEKNGLLSAIHSNHPECDTNTIKNFHREVYQDVLSGEHYIESLIDFQNGDILSFRCTISNTLHRFLRNTPIEVLHGLDTFNQHEMHLIEQAAQEYYKDEFELKGGIGNRVVYSSKGNIEDKIETVSLDASLNAKIQRKMLQESLSSNDYKQYSSSNELSKLADPNRSILKDLEVARKHAEDELNVYSLWIQKQSELANLELSGKEQNRAERKRQRIAKRILLRMRFTDDDEKYMRLAKQLEEVLELEDEEE